MRGPGSLAILATVLLITLPPIASTQQPPLQLFTIGSARIPPLAQAGPREKPWVRNRHALFLNASAVEQLGLEALSDHADIMMDLPTAGLVTAELRPQPRGTKPALKNGLAWTGRLRQTDTDVTLVISQHLVTGSIRIGRTLYEIKPVGEDAYHLIETDAEALPSDHHPIFVSKEELAAAGSSVTPGIAADTGSVIDVLVVYTEAAKNANGGQSGIEALIDLAVSMANQALANSQINTQFHLVDTAQVAYQESGSYNTDLSRLRNPSDGFMDEVHGLRDTHKADLVSLIEEDMGGVCGVAYVMTAVDPGFASWAFSVAQASCIVGYTFAHEVGHNMGSQHDRSEGGMGAYPYSFGHKEAGKFRTIMAYPCTPSCTRINHYSNPNVRYNGTWPTGIDDNLDPGRSADNARAFTNAIATVASFRTSGDAIPPPAPANLRIVDP